MKSEPMVSIITVCYNSEAYIEDTIESVFNQTYSNIEYVIIDGDSSDGTLEIIKEYEPKFEGRMQWISEPDEGIYQAMNKGTRLSKGSYVFFLNAGDYFVSNNVIKCMVNAAIERNGDLVYGDVLLGTDPKKRRNQKLTTKYQLLFRTICHQTILAHRKCLSDGDFDEEFNWLSDYKWVLRCFWNPTIKTLWVDKEITFFDPGNRTELSDSELKCKRLQERGKIGSSFFSFPFIFIFWLNQLRLKAKFSCWSGF